MTNAEIIDARVTELAIQHKLTEKHDIQEILNHYWGAFNSLAEWAQVADDEIPEHLMKYIDWEQIALDKLNKSEHYIIHDPEYGIHVFQWTNHEPIPYNRNEIIEKIAQHWTNTANPSDIIDHYFKEQMNFLDTKDDDELKTIAAYLSPFIR